MKRLLMLLTIFICCLNGCDNYKGWKKVDIPTSSELQATIKIQENWEFINDNNIIKLIDKDTNQILLEEIIEGFTGFPILKKGDTEIEFEKANKEDFNPNLDYDFSNVNYYTLDTDLYNNATYDKSAYIFEFNDGVNVCNVLLFNIYHDYDKNPNNYHYYLYMLIYDEFDDNLLKKFILSYTFAGIVNNKNSK